MQKISPLRASLEAFNKFKAQRAENKSQTDKTHSNPFGITFKGTVLQMDVFNSSTKKAGNTGLDTVKEKMTNVSKLTASAWIATINKFSTAKSALVSFGSKLKQDSIAVLDKMKNTKVDFNFMANTVGSLQRRPIGELEEMFGSELKALGA